VYFNAFDDAGETVTYPTAFTYTPHLYGTAAPLAVCSSNTTTLTIAASAGLSGFVFAEGY
jgi:hypothetical protein